MTAAAHENEASAPPRRPLGWMKTTVLAVVGLFYAYAVWNAIAFLVGYASGPLGLNGFGWFVLLFAVVFPVLVYLGAYVTGRDRPLLELTLVLLTGLGVVAVFWLNVVAYVTTNLASIVG